MPNLDIIRSVPAEIICAIIAAAGMSNEITVATWKGALSFLWVCRKWRLVAEPILFNILICGNEDHKYSRSNCELILERCCFEDVKQIVVCDNIFNSTYNFEFAEYPDNIDMMMNFGKLFDDEDGEEDTDLLELVGCGTAFSYEPRENRNNYEHYYEYEHFYDQYGNQVIYDKKDLDSKCKNVSTNIVSKLAAICPNVTQLSLRFTCPTITNEVLADILINHYMDQLVKLECNIRGIDFEPKNGRNIQSLVLGDYNPKFNQLPRLPTDYVNNLSLTFKGAFSWDLFKRGDLAPVSYDNLTRIELDESDKYINSIAHIRAPDSQLTDNPPLVVFPRLQTLVIRNKMFSYASLKHFLQSPINVLRVDGYIQHAYQMYEHNLDNLDRLILRISWHQSQGVIEFIELSNKLLAKADKISEVHLELDIRFVSFVWAKISWIHLTHFYVYVGEQAALAFAAIFKMPNLVYLEATIGAYIKSKALANVIKLIAELKNSCTEPLSSKINSVIITCLYEDPSTEFIEALEFLKWYLPELKKLTVVKD